MSSARFIVGDTRAVTATLPDDSVDLVLTSPPFLALRSYLPADDPNKPYEIGSEANPATFLDVLLELTEEWGRVLTPHGSICVELGDTYSGGTTEQQAVDRPQDEDGGYQSDQRVQHDGHRAGIRNMDNKIQGGGPGWPLAKSLCLIPQLYAASLAYGHNLLNPNHQFDPWRVRNIVRWVRPNPPVGALGDKFRPATSEMVVACKSAQRWFDLDAVRSPFSEATSQSAVVNTNGAERRAAQGGRPRIGPQINTHAGAPPLDWWKISPTGYGGAHYAVWPPELCVKPIEAMCPREVCLECGEPRRRLVDTTREMKGTIDPDWKKARSAVTGGGPMGHGVDITRTTTGWSDCEHNTYRPGVVLDPFAGSGTTLAVATGHSRDAIGIDLDPRNADLAHQRIGMFVTVEHHKETAT